MRSVIKKKWSEEYEYPCLKVIKTNELNSGTVVLFTAQCEGTVVHAQGCHPLSHYSDSWEMSCFEPFHNKVVLSNE